MKALEDLYYRNIYAAYCDLSHDSPQRKLVELIARHEKDLKATLNNTQQQSFDKFKDCVEERHHLTEVKAFSDGFSLAAKIMSEVMEAFPAD